jgi:hypothetical protein
VVVKEATVLCIALNHPRQPRDDAPKCLLLSPTRRANFGM